MKHRIRYDLSLITDDHIYHFKAGTHSRTFEILGSHVTELEGVEGTFFAVWAPNAKLISVIGDFNEWDRGAHKMKMRDDGSGIWECFIEGVEEGTVYKYYLASKQMGFAEEKSDPYAFFWEKPPRSATRTWRLDYEWNDKTWMDERKEKNTIHAPVSVYELHVGSWKRIPGEDNRPLNYRELADELVPYLEETGFTHVELLPITEHPYHGSWGYQTIGYFAPTSRFGTPQDFMYFVDKLHQHGFGVILDWVPSHFAVDMHGLGFFDGTNLYEHADPRQGFHPEWGSAIFNLGRNEVVNFLISSAVLWMEKYHIDGIRVDAVASMLYLNYARKEGEWIPNKYGGNENLESIDFLRKLNETLYSQFPGIMMIAEESTAWPMVTKPPYMGGLGFGFKWNMGWMHDTLAYIRRDPIYRKYHQDQITFSIWYAFHENFMLSLSHDEVVHMKGSLIYKMPGDYWQKFANMRLLYGYMFAHPGKKLLFMGCEFGQFAEWAYERSLDWHLLDYPKHAELLRLVGDLNRLYKSEPALWANDFEEKGFQWVDVSDHENSVLAFLRKGDYSVDTILVVCNFTPEVRHGYRVGVPYPGYWREIFNTDGHFYGGSNVGNNGGLHAEEWAVQEMPYSLNITLPPLAVLFFKIS